MLFAGLLLSSYSNGNHVRIGYPCEKFGMSNANPTQLKLYSTGSSLVWKAWHWVCKAWCWHFGYKHVGIGNAKVLRSGDYLMQGANAKGFALRWNIGFRLYPISTPPPDAALLKLTAVLNICCIHSAAELLSFSI